MIYPTTLYNFGKVCKDSVMVGNVLRALCKQDVELGEAELTMLEMIQNDNDWMNERVEAKREKDRKRQEERRKMSRGVTSCPRDKTDNDGVTTDECDNAVSQSQVATTPASTLSHSLPSSLPPFLPSYLPSSLKETTNRSVTVPARTRVREEAPQTERNGNGTVEMEIEGGKSVAKKLAVEFGKAVKADEGAFFDPGFDAVTICLALTGDYKSINRWRQLVKAKGDAAVRDEAFQLFREIRAGEDVNNRGAVLNERLADLRDQAKEKGGE